MTVIRLSIILSEVYVGNQTAYYDQSAMQRHTQTLSLPNQTNILHYESVLEQLSGYHIQC